MANKDYRLLIEEKNFKLGNKLTSNFISFN